METKSAQTSANDLLREQTNLVDEAAQLVTSVSSNLFDLTTYSKKHGSEAAKVVEETEEVSKKLIAYIDRVHGEIYALTGAMKDSDSELDDLRNKNNLLNTTLAENNKLLVEKNKLLKSLQSKNEAQRKFNLVQAHYTSALGAIMGTMLWKTSKAESAINTYISESMIGEFLGVANVTLNSFLDMYKEEPPLADTNEHKMVTSVLGVCINISAQNLGREFVVENPIGITFIENILKYLSAYPMPSCILLKRMSLMFLFNVIILNQGVRIINASSNGVVNILGCLSPDQSDEIYTLTLEFLVFFLEQVDGLEKKGDLNQREDLDRRIRNLISRNHLELLLKNDNTKHLCQKFCKMINVFREESLEF